MQSIYLKDRKSRIYH